MKISDYSNYNNKNIIEAELRIKERWRKNKINLEFKKKDKILIFGNLNYSEAMLNLGTNLIHAVDNCKKPHFFKKPKYSKIKYEKIDLNLKLNYQKESFDFIFCNGVLSHLKNWEKVLKNFYQLLKPKGMLWLNVFDDSKFRKLPINMHKKINDKDRIMVKNVLQLSGWDVGKIKYIQETFFWKERTIFNKIKLENKIKKIGFQKYTFCKRGYKDDLNEMIYKNNKLKKIYGSGDLRYMIYK